MKKILVIALAVVMMVSALALVACGPQTKVAYGRVHKSYAGKATVVIQGGKIVSADIDEACLPTQASAGEDLGEYTVEATSKGNTVYYYKTVKFDDVTMVYDAEKGSYMVGETKAADWLVDNSEKYFEAAASDKVKAVTANGEVVLGADKLLKSKNGYWATPAEAALGWKANVEATCAYVVANGIGAITAKEDFTQANNGGKLDNEWVDANGVKTGATWSDMWDYLVVLKAAIEK